MSPIIFAILSLLFIAGILAEIWALCLPVVFFLIGVFIVNQKKKRGG